ncbi:MAG: ChbG/HpnK family deacetylase [Geminicoccaceae bacterium]|nr:ChbG/HpnK family deacetylase [Geminicoccaceae bacterium]
MNGAGAPRPLILCADDYGLAPGVDAGILELLEAGRLSAVSCMTQSPRWPETAKALLPWRDRIDIGLHLTLTDQEPLGDAPALAPSGKLPSLGRLARLLIVDPRARAEARAQLERQLAAFHEALGRPPDHIDGHQHVHLLPAVREAVIAAARRIAAQRPIYLRSCWEAPQRIARRGGDRAKALFLALLGRGLHRRAAAAGIPTNDSFRGASRFVPGPQVRAEFRRFLAGPGRRPLVMCHPGRTDAELRARDPLTRRREDELRYLASPAFPADLARAERFLARFDGSPPGRGGVSCAP